MQINAVFIIFFNSLLNVEHIPPWTFIVLTHVLRKGTIYSCIAHQPVDCYKAITILVNDETRGAPK